MKAAVRRNVGVPVCVGIASTKTLAKLANKWAKNNPAFDGVCHWDSVPAAEREGLMRRLSVIEIWGVATRLTKRLNGLGIHSILDLSRADPVMIRDRFSVVMMRTVLELQGTPCIPMEEERIGRDQLIFSRSFATPITTAAGMRQVMSVYGQQASARLAKHGLQAKVLTAFAGTSHFNPKDTSYPSVCVPLPMPTADPVLLTKAAHALLPRIHEGIKYARAGIMVTDLRPTGNQAPLALFENPHEERRVGTLLEDVDPPVRARLHRPRPRRHPGRTGLDHETGHALPPLHHPLGRTPPRQSRLTQPTRTTAPRKNTPMTLAPEAPTQTRRPPGPDRHGRQTPRHPPRRTDLACRSRHGVPALVRQGRLVGHPPHGRRRQRRPGQHRILARAGPARLELRTADRHAAPRTRSAAGGSWRTSATATRHQ